MGTCLAPLPRPPSNVFAYTLEGQAFVAQSLVQPVGHAIRSSPTKCVHVVVVEVVGSKECASLRQLCIVRDTRIVLGVYPIEFVCVI